MTIRVYNTLGGKKEPFEPIEEGKVRMYVCGPTVYDSSHIGHARSVVVFDVIARYLRAQSYDVTYVRNFTDVDDKIINRARELEVDSKTLAETYIDEFHKDMDLLKVLRADHEPKVTEHIDSIIKFITILIDRGCAYESGGDVFFAIDRFKDYGKLSGRNTEEMEAGARVGIDERKRNPLDFALWKAAKPGEPSWESPWGVGRPGWHIECSAMNYVFFGESFDIHGGGKDLIFPHHENEIAQSEGAFGKPMAKYWIHNGFVNIDREKMSKSLGNFLMIKDVLKHHHPEVIRLFLLSNHYRSPIDYSVKSMEEASSGLDKIYTLLERIEAETGPDTGKNPKGDYWNRFEDAMNDDFNTARGIGVIFEAVRNANRLLDEAGETPSPETLETVGAIRSDILEMGRILGLLSEPPAAYFEHRKIIRLQQTKADVKAIEQLVDERTAARKARDFQKADRIRDQLTDMGVTLEDRPDGVVWRMTK